MHRGNLAEFGRCQFSLSGDQEAEKTAGAPEATGMLPNSYE
jgi:hypothetical protein